MAKKLNSILFVLIYVAVFFLAQIVAITAKPLSDTLLYLINGEREPFRLFEYFFNRIEGQKVETVYIYLAAIVLTLIVVCVIIYARKKNLSSYIKKRRMTFKEIIASVLFAYGLNVISAAIISIPALTPFQESYETAIDSVVIGNIYAMLLIVALLGPAFEEILFRGFIFGELKSGGGFWFANILQAVLFGIMHMNVIQGLYAAVAGFVFGFVYYRTENIYVAILTHILFNGSNILITQHLLYAQGETIFYLSGAAALLIGFYLIYNRKINNRPA